VYAGAFVVLLVAAYILARGNIQSSLRFVWLSMGLSGLAAVGATLSVFIPGRAPSDSARAAVESRSEDPSGSPPRQPAPTPSDARDPAPDE
jgi:hypothetical protein